MFLLRILPILWLVVWHVSNVTPQGIKKLNLQEKLLQNYNFRIRPVKKETTVTQVMVFLNIAHVEKVDEEEQTVLVHGHLWASWMDEYIAWDRKKENMTRITIPSYRLWQPAIALYNSARGNLWHLSMYGLPANVFYTGKVWASGSFSFHVTCQFDFTNWPFDSQECPIVLADWVYGLAQVNLSDPNLYAEYAKPSIRLNFDPLDSSKKKRHVGGWEVFNSWKKHCYWGPGGCNEEAPKDNYDQYWSLLEFGVILKRHLPYFQMTVIFPVLTTCALILLLFWLDSFFSCLFMIMFNIVIQATYGWNILGKMPPGSGRTPKIIHLYVLNIIITILQISLLVFFKLFRETMPKDYTFNLGFDITEIPKKVGLQSLFASKGLSFDPQELFSGPESESIEGILERGGDSASTSIGIGNPLNDDAFDNFQGSATSSSFSDNQVLIDLPTSSNAEPVLKESIENLNDKKEEEENTKEKKANGDGKLCEQLHHINRFLFYAVVIAYIMTLLLFLYT